MKLTNTRAKDNEKLKKVSLSKAILNPSGLYGGLYAPKKLPQLNLDFFLKATELNYSKFAIKIIKKFKFDISTKIFKAAIKRYESFDDPKDPVPFNKLGKNLYINELYHGPTRAFKDMALQPFGEIFNSIAESRGEKYLVACATSGDTGPATLATFENSKNVKVVCLYPDGGTSGVQRLQMSTASANNLKVLAVKGNFDDAQRVLKNLLLNDEFKAELDKMGLKLSAANSVNFGRILFQIIYHAYAYVRLLKNGELTMDESFDIIVPSGNFGNALGAYYAKKMGVKIDKIKIASNSNNILTEFFNTGIYDLREKKLIKTISPAMDILISSNIERLLFDKFGAVRTKELMDSLAQNGYYELSDEELLSLKEDFQADFCTDEKCAKYIKKWAKKGVLLDPHTATCLKMRDKSRLNVITSTAEWVKFAPSMSSAIDKEMSGQSELEQIKWLCKIGNTHIRTGIEELFIKKSKHEEVFQIEQIKPTVLEWLK